MPGEFTGKRIIVMGLGRFGGGIGVTRWLCAQGARVLVTDLADEAKLAESLRELGDLELTRRLGGHDEADLDGCELLVVSPAVDKTKSAFFKAAVARGIPWTSEMNLFLDRCRGRVIGITGTVGKSTTTAMIGAVLDQARRSPTWRYGNVWLGGNIGKSLLDDLPSISEHDIVVLELSSFQLEDAGQIRRSPHVAVITNLRDNHLDRHGTMQAYAEAKANIYSYQSPDDHLAMPLEEDLRSFPGDWARRPLLWRFGVDREARLIRLARPRSLSAGAAAPGEDRVHARLCLPGLHNLMNAAAAMTVSRILGAADDVALAALSEFAGLPHRLEFVREVAGVRYYNDSKATTPEAAMTSLAAFDSGVVMLVGGSDKGSDFTQLGRAIADRAKAAVCIGQTREQLAVAIQNARGDRKSPIIERAEDFTSAMKLARSHAAPGDVVLLSPACASYDWFRNYEDRGDQFKQLVRTQ